MTKKADIAKEPIDNRLKMQLYVRKGLFKLISKRGSTIVLQEQPAMSSVGGSVVNPVKMTIKNDMFDQKYKKITSDLVDVGEAMGFLKANCAVSRRAWGANEYVVLMNRGFTLISDSDMQDVHAVSQDARLTSNEGADVKPYLVKVFSDGSVQYGWLPSTEDLLACDYYVTTLSK